MVLREFVRSLFDGLSVLVLLLMGQGSGRQERSKKLELATSETMQAEADVQSDKEEAEETKTRDERLRLVFGMADLKNKAIGLYNIGQTCCLNSLLQVFLMNTHFTGTLRRITVPPSASQKRRSVPYQMLLLLEEMQCGKRKAVCPRALACCLTEHRVKLFVQYDAAQLLLTLWNLVNKQMTNPELIEKLRDLYTICVQECMLCQECSSETKRNSNMITLPLSMLDSGCHLLKTLSMKLVHLPQTLILHLKRFCLRKSASIHKLCHYLPFPQDLDFSAVLTEEQCQADASEKASWQYELFAVVVHSGSTDCGHYCAYIQSLTERKWYCFDDSEVCQVLWDDVKCTYGHSDLHWGQTAYLLVYMKKNS
ncbi:ubl carboxyl-terminal hydrolase 18 isoform X2 [Dromaius novaehollandiae]|uniref:ubl carboxyl-terminal hydrolase 18 isoform X2 n=1 Tax=Dromaius novaehollandiae TaxID=8790 RepID=UPI00311E7ADD